MKTTMATGIIAVLIILVTLAGCDTAGPRSATQTGPCPGGFTADAIVTYFSDGSEYYTPHDYRICPAARSITVSAMEPQGRFVWRFANGQFQVDTPAAADQKSPNQLYNSKMLQATLAAFMAGSDQFAALPPSQLRPVRIEGQWYQPIPAAGEGASANLVFYRNQSTQAIDRVQVTDPATGQTYIGLAYNFLWSSALETNLPRKVDLFVEQAHSAPMRVLQIELTAVNAL